MPKAAVQLPASPMNSSQAPSSPLFRPASLVAAIVLPGLGHFIGGERLRGILIAVGVLGLFFGGMLIGGIDVIDSREDRVWFFGQALVGPTAFAVDWAHQTQFKVIDPTTRQLRTAYPGEGRDPSGMAVAGGTPPNIKSINKVNDIGTLYATIAGMLNLICILDAGWPPRRRHNPAVPS
jgi:hypothetical protein